jgi:putative membrane protein
MADLSTDGLPARLSAISSRLDGADALAYGGMLGLGGLLSWLSRAHPALMPVWGPWDFSWIEFLAAAVPLWWFFRGLARSEPDERLPAWRCASFLFGLIAIYAVLQTRFDYMAQHMFFLNRLQHVVMHHLGPFFIALGGVDAPLRRGMPEPVRRLVGSRCASLVMRGLQQPVIAVLLFVGLFYLWLIPAVHFRAMIDPRLYALMNWSMVVDGMIFWVVVLDGRPKPPARLSFGVRAAMAYAITFPEILIGCYLTSVDRDLYPFYALCGRLFPSIDALTDQHIGALFVWVPPAMMSAAATMIVLRAFLRHEESLEMPAQAPEPP